MICMLAAAGSPDVHLLATNEFEDRERWDRDMANFDRELHTLDAFFQDLAGGKLRTA